VKVLVTGCLTLLEDINIYISYEVYCLYGFSVITFFHVILVPFIIILYMVVRFVFSCLIL